MTNNVELVELQPDPITFGDIKWYDAFVFDGALFVKINDQDAINISIRCEMNFNSSAKVRRVDTVSATYYNI